MVYLLVGCSLLLLPGLALVGGGPIVSLFRTSISLSLFVPDVVGWMLVSVGLFGVVGLLALYYRGYSIPVAGIVRVLVGLEFIGVLAAFVVRLSSSIHGLPVVILSVERGLWFSLGYLAVFLMPLSAIVYLSRVSASFRLPARLRPSRDSRYAGEMLLVVAVMLGLLSPLITHSPPFNPSLSIVSSDTLSNLGFVEEFRDKGFLGGILSLAGWLRPLYMAFVYVAWRVSPVDPSILFDVLVPAVGFSLIALSVYWLLAPVASHVTRGLASVLAVLYWSPAFTYAGYQTNLLAIPVALASTRLLWEGRLALFTLSSIVLGLWHPWTMAYYMASWLLYTALSSRFGRHTLPVPASRVAASMASSAMTVLIVQAVLLHVSPARGYEALGGFVGTVSVSISLSALLFSYYEYTWGTIARPELQLPACVALMRGADPRLASLLIPAFLAYPLLNQVSAYRILLTAPIPIGTVAALKPGSPWTPAVVAAALASWVILLINSPPAFSAIPG